jgi:hypothetical protein
MKIPSNRGYNKISISIISIRLGDGLGLAVVRLSRIE